MTPGPGTYNHREPQFTAPYTRRATSSFSSKSKRYFDHLVDQCIAGQSSQNGNNNVYNVVQLDDDVVNDANDAVVDKQNSFKQRAAFNTSEKRLPTSQDLKRNIIQNILFAQSQFENSRKVNPSQSKKSIIENILSNKFMQNDKPGPGNYCIDQRASTPAITSVFVSTTPKLHYSKSRIDRSESFKDMFISPRRHRSSRRQFHLDLNKL